MTDVGDLVRFGNPSQDTASAAFTTLAGAAADPTAVTLIIERPDATRLVYGWPTAGASGTLVRESPGRFYFDVLLDQSGTWRYRLAGTGTVTAASEGSLRVQRQRVAP
jgi:hypothetical protein